MRHSTLLSILAAGGLLFAACERDDSSFSDYDFTTYSLRSEQGDDDSDDTTLADTIALKIVWDGSYAYLTGETGDSVALYSPSTNSSDVVIRSTTQRYLQITVSGSSTDGSLLVYAEKAWGLVLDGLTLNNGDGPAVNNQCGKALHVTVADGTANSLTDGTAYAEAAIDQKATFFSEGQVYFRGTGTLSVTGNCKNAIASDDYIVVEAGGPTLTVSANGSNGIKVNDGMEIYGGIVDISVSSNGGRGIRSEDRVTIGGGTTTITTTGDPVEETLDDGSTDYSAAAGVKCDSLFTMTGGTLTITSTGDGGKGINCSQNVEVSGGTLTVTTTGTNFLAKPKGVKSDTGIFVSGGRFAVSVEKSWACDNGTDSDEPADHVTIVGTPAQTPTVEKKTVIIDFNTLN